MFHTSLSVINKLKYKLMRLLLEDINTVFSYLHILPDMNEELGLSQQNTSG